MIKGKLKIKRISEFENSFLFSVKTYIKTRREMMIKKLMKKLIKLIKIKV